MPRQVEIIDKGRIFDRAVIGQRLAVGPTNNLVIIIFAGNHIIAGAIGGGAVGVGRGPRDQSVAQ